VIVVEIAKHKIKARDIEVGWCKLTPG